MACIKLMMRTRGPSCRSGWIKQSNWKFHLSSYAGRHQHLSALTHRLTLSGGYFNNLVFRPMLHTPPSYVSLLSTATTPIAKGILLVDKNFLATSFKLFSVYCDIVTVALRFFQFLFCLCSTHSFWNIRRDSYFYFLFSYELGLFFQYLL